MTDTEKSINQTLTNRDENVLGPIKTGGSVKIQQIPGGLGYQPQPSDNPNPVLNEKRAFEEGRNYFFNDDFNEKPKYNFDKSKKKLTYAYFQMMSRAVEGRLKKIYESVQNHSMKAIFSKWTRVVEIKKDLAQSTKITFKQNQSEIKEIHNEFLKKFIFNIKTDEKNSTNKSSKNSGNGLDNIYQKFITKAIRNFNKDIKNENLKRNESNNKDTLELIKKSYVEKYIKEFKFDSRKSNKVNIDNNTAHTSLKTIYDEYVDKNIKNINKDYLSHKIVFKDKSKPLKEALHKYLNQNLKDFNFDTINEPLKLKITDKVKNNSLNLIHTKFMTNISKFHHDQISHPLKIKTKKNEDCLLSIHALYTKKLKKIKKAAKSNKIILKETKPSLGFLQQKYIESLEEKNVEYLQNVRTNRCRKHNILELSLLQEKIIKIVSFTRRLKTLKMIMTTTTEEEVIITEECYYKILKMMNIKSIQDVYEYFTKYIKLQKKEITKDEPSKRVILNKESEQIFSKETLKDILDKYMKSCCSYEIAKDNRSEPLKFITNRKVKDNETLTDLHEDYIYETYEKKKIEEEWNKDSEASKSDKYESIPNIVVNFIDTNKKETIKADVFLEIMKYAELNDVDILEEPKEEIKHKEEIKIETDIKPHEEKKEEAPKEEEHPKEEEKEEEKKEEKIIEDKKEEEISTRPKPKEEEISTEEKKEEEISSKPKEEIEVEKEVEDLEEIVRREKEEEEKKRVLKSKMLTELTTKLLQEIRTIYITEFDSRNKVQDEEIKSIVIQELIIQLTKELREKTEHLYDEKEKDAVDFDTIEKYIDETITKEYDDNCEKYISQMIERAIELEKRKRRQEESKKKELEGEKESESIVQCKISLEDIKKREKKEKKKKHKKSHFENTNKYPYKQEKL